jgi:hypothetical protein
LYSKDKNKIFNVQIFIQKIVYMLVKLEYLFFIPRLVFVHKTFISMSNLVIKDGFNGSEAEVKAAMAEVVSKQGNFTFKDGDILSVNGVKTIEVPEKGTKKKINKKHWVCVIERGGTTLERNIECGRLVPFALVVDENGIATPKDQVVDETDIVTKAIAGKRIKISTATAIGFGSRVGSAVDENGADIAPAEQQFVWNGVIYRERDIQYMTSATAID